MITIFGSEPLFGERPVHSTPHKYRAQPEVILGALRHRAAACSTSHPQHTRKHTCKTQGEACWAQPEVILGALRHRASRLAATAADTLKGESCVDA